MGTIVKLRLYKDCNSNNPKWTTQIMMTVGVRNWINRITKSGFGTNVSFYILFTCPTAWLLVREWYSTLNVTKMHLYTNVVIYIYVTLIYHFVSTESHDTYKDLDYRLLQYVQNSLIGHTQHKQWLQLITITFNLMLQKQIIFPKSVLNFPLNSVIMRQRTG